MPEPDSADPWSALRALALGQRLELEDGEGHTWVGTVIPPHELSSDRVISLKLESGYNVGVRVTDRTRFRLLGGRPPARPTAAHARRTEHRGAEVVELLTTGGTIASRIDYETGGVAPVSDEAEILSFYPELRSAGDVRIVPVLDRLSENIVPADWLLLAGKVVEAFGRGARGVVIAHGTDTLGHTAAALSFLLADLPGPVVLVGAQRSPDRPSSDGPSNLAAAVLVARHAPLGEVVVVMHEAESDGRFSIHRGTWVRKMHSSRRDAFRSRNGPVLGTVAHGRVELHAAVHPPSPGPARVEGPLDDRAGVLWFYPGLSAERAEAFAAGLRGVVLAGTGLGHLSITHLDWIRRATERGVVVAMTTQCLEGTVDPFVYSTGRELLRAGVVYLDDLLPETAYAKMVWALGRSSSREEVVRLLRTDRAGEFVERRRPEGSG